MNSSPIENVLAFIQPCFPEISISDKAIILLSRLQEDQRSLILPYLYKNFKNNPYAAKDFECFKSSLPEIEPESWLEAFCAVLTWLEREERTASLREVVSYLSCCEEMNSANSVSLSLKAATEEALTTFGFHSAVKSR
jgi:hypothetical protein